MNILSIQKDHNSSACLYMNNELVYYNQEERLSRIKKDSGYPYYTLQEIQKICKDIDVLLISGYDSVLSENLSIISLLQKMGFVLSQGFEFVPYNKAHHLYHAAKAFYDSGFDDALVFVCDGKGSTYNLSNGGQAQETSSIFEVNKKRNFKLLYRRFHTHSKIDKDTKIIWHNQFTIHRVPRPRYVSQNSEIEISNSFDLGFMYEGTSRSMGLDDEGGKMMSAQSFGNDNWLVPEPLKDGEFNMNLFDFDHERKHLGFTRDHLEFLNDEFATDFAKKVQKAFEKIGLDRIKSKIETTGHKNIVLTGGTALNVVANYYFRQQLPEDVNLYVDPLCGDEGNCIGLALHYINEKNKNETPISTPSIYIGGNDPEYNYLNKLQEGEKEFFANYETIVELLQAGQIVGLYQGRSEAGPRALGNRSIIFDPRIDKGKDIVNTVKGRESFRPFAATVMEEYAKDWFELDKIDSSPYMMYAVNAKKETLIDIPAVLHIDNTCRIQTVNKEQNFHFYNLLNAWYNETNIPMLLNTSFNLAGDPIVETVDDAIDSLRRSKLQYLYMPEIKRCVYIPN